MDGIPHIRGGDPFNPQKQQKNLQVFPTYVGVILYLNYEGALIVGIPHIRGGDPRTLNRALDKTMYSPHTWG